MYNENGLIGFLTGADRIINKRASLCEDLKFAIWQNEKEPKELRLSKNKIIMAGLKQTSFMKNLAIFPDISEYSSRYRNT